jgi:hypothetical protein
VKSLVRMCVADVAGALLAFVVLAALFALLGDVTHPHLPWGFAHVPRTLSQTFTILWINANDLWGRILIVAVLVQARRELRAAWARRLLIAFFDIVVAVLILHNLALPLGVGLGVFGWRMVCAILPAGPVELFAFALATSVYLHSRRTLIDRRRIAQPVALGLLSGVLLAAAALLETFT